MTISVDYEEMADARQRLLTIADAAHSLVADSPTFALGYNSLNAAAGTFQSTCADEVGTLVKRTTGLVSSVAKAEAEFRQTDSESGASINHLDGIASVIDAVING